jgi:hypothetical protein
VNVHLIPIARRVMQIAQGRVHVHHALFFVPRFMTPYAVVMELHILINVKLRYKGLMWLIMENVHPEEGLLVPTIVNVQQIPFARRQQEVVRHREHVLAVRICAQKYGTPYVDVMERPIPVNVRLHHPELV